MGDTKTAIEGFEGLRRMAEAEPKISWADLVRLQVRDPKVLEDERVKLWLDECEKRILRELEEMGSPEELLAAAFSGRGIHLRR